MEMPAKLTPGKKDEWTVEWTEGRKKESVVANNYTSAVARAYALVQEGMTQEVVITRTSSWTVA